MEDEVPSGNLPRPPVQDDLVSLCRELNARGAKYLVVGGMAVNVHGYLRATEDIDILLEGSPDNQQRVCAALEYLPDRAILELEGADLRDYVVVRVADEIVVDLMLAASLTRKQSARCKSWRCKACLSRSPPQNCC